ELRVARQAANAVRAAIGMQRAMTGLNTSWAEQKRESHLIRIGINTGVVTVGNMGTDYLWDYTVVGTEVNKAQRLEGAGQPGGILLSNRTYLLARQQGALPEDIPSQPLALKSLGVEAELHMITPELAAKLEGKGADPIPH